MPAARTGVGEYILPEVVRDTSGDDIGRPKRWTGLDEDEEEAQRQRQMLCRGRLRMRVLERGRVY
ncbi:hypothetical protein A0H81_09190 [Grifola frondosa]|uniref:Uncharacterized protein n=1 Tax=Grifola frondosa TaxID=5627 RepID=A0A1C7M137_GRIFR|nr:hypothetical protein A0H81_09190 [Grifola frondosa]